MSNTSKTPKKRAAAKTTVVKKRKSGSGRTKGSFSFINVTLRQLTSYVQPDAVVLVSRKWAENIGLVGEPMVASTNNHNSIKNPVGITTHNMGEEEVNAVQCTMQTDL
tara:strand:- start:6432 stop:6755 length:324 start_codon:yes stop_codon:yes gene_type:complete